MNSLWQQICAEMIIKHINDVQRSERMCVASLLD